MLYPPSPYDWPPTSAQDASMLGTLGSPATDVSSLRSSLQTPTGIHSPSESAGNSDQFSGAGVGSSFGYSCDGAAVSGPVGESLPGTSPTLSAASPVRQGEGSQLPGSLNFGALHMLLMAMSPELQAVGAEPGAGVNGNHHSLGQYSDEVIVPPAIQIVPSQQSLQASSDCQPKPEPVMSAVWNPWAEGNGYSDDVHAGYCCNPVVGHHVPKVVSNNPDPGSQLSVSTPGQQIQANIGNTATDTVGAPLRFPGLLERRRHSFAGATRGAALRTPSGPVPFRVSQSNLGDVSYEMPGQSHPAIMFPTPPPSADGGKRSPRKRSIDERDNQLVFYNPTSLSEDGLPDFRKRSRSFDLTAAYSMPTNNSVFHIGSYQDLQPYLVSEMTDALARVSGRPEPCSFQNPPNSCLDLNDTSFSHLPHHDVLHSYSVPVITSRLHHPPPSLSGKNIPSTPSFETSPDDPDNPHAIPRRQRLRYPGDMYTPKWVRHVGAAKEGFCDTCDPGKWLQLKNSAYWYHKQFHHGISSVSGNTFVDPIEKRTVDSNVVEGLCHQCGQWVVVSSAKRRNLVMWFRHAHKCHVYSKAKCGAAMQF